MSGDQTVLRNRASRANKCLNQDKDTRQYCGLDKGHDGDHLNVHTLMRWSNMAVSA